MCWKSFLSVNLPIKCTLEIRDPIYGCVELVGVLMPLLPGGSQDRGLDEIEKLLDFL